VWLVEPKCLCVGLCREMLQAEKSFSQGIEMFSGFRLDRERYFRQVFLMCDEYQTFATVGQSDPIGDEKFFSLSRQSKCIPIVATQSISSLKSTLSGDSYRTLLQTFRTKIFLALADDFSTRLASELCGREDRPFVSTTFPNRPRLQTKPANRKDGF
jgi:type IV secretory pathway TraG/TraD family ATPase VirD4